MEISGGIHLTVVWRCEAQKYPWADWNGSHIPTLKPESIDIDFQVFHGL